MSIPCTVSQFFKQVRRKPGPLNVLADAEFSAVRCRDEVVLVATVTDERTTLAGKRSVTIVPLALVPELIASLQAATKDGADCDESARDWIRVKRAPAPERSRHGGS